MESLDHSNRRQSGILKQPDNYQSTVQQVSDHVKFDEDIIAEHDKFRGTRTKIDEPKTPYTNDNQLDQDDDQQTEDQPMEDVHLVNINDDHKHDTNFQQVEEEVKKHLEEAERNKLLNAQLQKENQQNLQQNFHSELNQRLDQTQLELDEEQRKHQEFLKKRKEHYKNEMKAAQLLKKQSIDDEDDEDQ